MSNINLRQPIGSGTGLTTEDALLVRTNIGLGNVSNTADADKPVSTAQASAIAEAVATKANLAGGNTLAGNQTLSGQLQLTGQAVVDGNSAMTRGLVAMESLYTVGQVFRAQTPTFAAGTGAGAGAVAGAYSVSLTSGTTANAYGIATIATHLTSFQNFQPTSYIDFSKTIGVSLRMAANVTANNTIRLTVGGPSSAAVQPAWNAAALAVAGFGFQLSSTSIRSFAHNGTTYTTGPWYPFTTLQACQVGVISYGNGNVSLIYANSLTARPVVLGTQTGGPTGMGSSTGRFVDIIAQNAASGTSTGATFSATDVVFYIG